MKFFTVVVLIDDEGVIAWSERLSSISLSLSSALLKGESALFERHYWRANAFQVLDESGAVIATRRRPANFSVGVKQ